MKLWSKTSLLGTEHEATFNESLRQVVRINNMVACITNQPDEDFRQQMINAMSARGVRTDYSPRGEDVYRYIYTSGTTGPPKPPSFETKG